jgi:hypothetical protein
MSRPFSRIDTYWKCQLGGWGFYALANLAFSAMFRPFHAKGIALAIVTSALGLGLTHAYRSLIRRRGWQRLPIGAVSVRAIAASVLISAIMVATTFPLFIDFVPPEMRLGVLSINLFNWSATALGWSLIYFGYQYFVRIQSTEAEKWRLQVAMRDRELDALRMQLNPHFLFNSLNSLRALISEDPARAQDAVTRLASLLRYTLRLSQSESVPLAQEIEATRNYLELERMRFEERLRFEIDVAPELHQLRVPPMLVQTLVENAVKHGIATLPAGGEVRVHAAQLDEALVVRISNTGRIGVEDGDGIGLQNSMERLQLMFGEGGRLRLFADGPDRVTAEAVIPAAAPAALQVA